MDPVSRPAFPMPSLLSSPQAQVWERMETGFILRGELGPRCSGKSGGQRYRGLGISGGEVEVDGCLWTRGEVPKGSQA